MTSSPALRALDARLATLALAMDLAALYSRPEMVDYYAEQYDALVEQKITSEGPAPEGYEHG